MNNTFVAAINIILQIYERLCELRWKICRGLGSI